MTSIEQIIKDFEEKFMYKYKDVDANGYWAWKPDHHHPDIMVSFLQTHIKQLLESIREEIVSQMKEPCAHCAGSPNGVHKFPELETDAWDSATLKAAHIITKYLE